MIKEEQDALEDIIMTNYLSQRIQMINLTNTEQNARSNCNYESYIQ